MKNIIIYLTLAFPNEEKFFKILDMLDRLGVYAVEIGIPDDNPFMDGKTIQASHHDVLKRKYSPETIVSMIQTIMSDYRFETVLMGYQDSFESNRIIGHDALTDAHLLCVNKALTFADHPKVIQLYDPDMDESAIQATVKHNTLFAYCMSHKSKTGVQLETSTDTAETIETVKKHAAIPAFLGFGIKDDNHAEKAASMGADGIIIGSAFVSKSIHGSIADLEQYVKDMNQAFNNRLEVY
ncbi:tryptophan synthase subunit alpha [Salisediminibacterium beveridgei]|uniref:tryptophan synthase n=1 Tax=Salisediminibacterium beveridgei TaxID=632773 RepID=A0A1D7QZV0_9BACI|nr:tryptophan synthase subunit alpha [Salisediminibacterium beveridgei]AOM84490.1 Tryptophan synthase alpha chain [Salisediminibacterium beveridgei]